MIYPPLGHWLWLIPAFAVGACIGSFLNVVIYRLPRGMSVNQPKRSFCPECRKPIPFALNLPLLSWLWLRGTCRNCGCRIPARYVLVELVTALAFAAVWQRFMGSAPVAAVILLWVLLALLIAITFIDAEHLVIPSELTWAGTICGLAAGAVWPQLPQLGATAGGTASGLLASAIGWGVGFGGLWIVVELGKLAFGKKAMKFARPVAWHLLEPAADQDPMCFVIDGETIAWWDLFTRKSDRLIVETTAILLDGEPVGGGTLVIREQGIELPDGSQHHLADMKSLSGMATSAVVPREAMGMGDVHLLGMIGAFIGWSGVFVSLFGASVFAIIAAVIGRIGFGRQLPFGPYLALGAVAWLFGAWQLWAWYLSFLEPLFQH